MNPPTRRGIAAAGNWIIDHVKRIDVWPQEETLANILGEYRGSGGAPYNVSLDLRALDPTIPLSAIGVLGRDADGDSIAADMAAHDIRSFFRRSDTQPTSYTDVMSVHASGRRTFFHNRGANTELAPADFPWNALDARILHLGYLLLLDALDAEDPEYGTVAARVLEEARKRGIITSVDVVSEHSDRFARISRPALPHTDYLVCNEIEAGRIAGMEIRSGDVLDFDVMAQTARTLLDMGVRSGVVIHVPEGGYACLESGEERFQPSLRLPDGYIQGAAGAGDAFCAGFLYSVHENWSLERGLELAVCTAAASLGVATCTGGISSVAETLSLLEKYSPA